MSSSLRGLLSLVVLLQCTLASAVPPEEGLVHTLRVLEPRSSTHCDLVALGLAWGLGR